MLFVTLQLNVTCEPAVTVDGLAVKLEMVGEGPVGTLASVTIVPICTTSKLDAVMLFSRLRSLLFHRVSGAPLMKMPLPLSARIIPYFLSAVRMTWSSAGKPEMSKLAFRRSRVPMGGELGSVSVEAQWEAGATNARRVVGTVKRNAWLMAPAAT